MQSDITSITEVTQKTESIKLLGKNYSKNNEDEIGFSISIFSIRLYTPPINASINVDKTCHCAGNKIF